MKITPLKDRVVVKLVEEAQKTAGGIYLPETAQKDSSNFGEIVAVGEGKVDDNGTKIPVSLSVGSRVLYAKYAGNEVKDSGTTYVVLKEDDILAIVED